MLENKKLLDFMYAEPELFFKNHVQYCDDRDLMLLAVEIHSSRALVYASERLKNDREIVVIAMKKQSWAFEFASLALRSNFSFALYAVAFDTANMQYVTDLLKSNKDFLMLALENYEETKKLLNFDIVLPSPFEYASDSLKDEIGNNDPLKYLLAERFSEELHNKLKNNKDSKTFKRVKI